LKMQIGEILCPKLPYDVDPYSYRLHPKLCPKINMPKY
jgi:hypothetical protein